MKKMYVCIISILPLLAGNYVSAQQAEAVSDTIEIPLKINFGLEATGPVIYFTNKDLLNTEGYFSFDLNEKRSLYAGGGYSNYKYSQYNYVYQNKGIFARTGMAFNILDPEISKGKYWAGVALLYGVSRFTWSVDSFKYENYWGKITSSIPAETDWGHYIEISPGFRAEMLKNLSIGWSVSLKKLLFTSSSGDLKPAYFPGFGSTEKSVTFGVQYFISVNFSYKKIKVPVKVEESVETGEEEGIRVSPGMIRQLR